MNTRLAKLDAPDSPFAALILAHAGLYRLGWFTRITQVLDAPLMYYAVGQGALAVECRENDTMILNLLGPLGDYHTTLTCIAERALMKRLEGGCSVPLGVSSVLEGGTLTLSSIVCSLDGKTEIVQSMCEDICLEIDGNSKDLERSFEDSRLMGVNLADRMIKLGAKVLLDKIRIENQRLLLLE